jgi:hypothetical protein
MTVLATQTEFEPLSRDYSRFAIDRAQISRGSCLRPKLEEVQTRVRNLISKWTAGMDNSRHQADSGAKYSLYFDLLRDRANVYSKQLLKFLIAG